MIRQHKWYFLIIILISAIIGLFSVFRLSGAKTYNIAPEPTSLENRAVLAKKQAIPLVVGEVKTYIHEEAVKYGVNPRIADFILKKESQYGENMIGDDGNSRGYWMISKIYHPEISDKCAFSLKCSTDWSLKQIIKGHINWWSTFKFCRQWYKDCPF